MPGLECARSHTRSALVLNEPPNVNPVDLAMAFVTLIAAAWASWFVEQVIALLFILTVASQTLTIAAKCGGSFQRRIEMTRLAS